MDMFRSKIIIFASLIVGILFWGCAAGGSSTTGKSYPYTVRTEDDTITTTEGDIIITNARARIDEAIYPSGKEEYKNIKGDINNKTGIYLSDARLSVNFIRGGTSVKTEDITVFGIQPGISSFENMFVFTNFYRQEGDDIDFSLSEATGLYTYDISLSNSKSQGNSLFEGDTLNVAFSVEPSNISFRAKNVSEKPISILWNRVSFVDRNGTSNGIIHKGIKYSDAGSSMAPTTIPPNSSINETIHPTDNIRYSEQINEWEKEPILPVEKNIVSSTSGVTPQDMVGTTFSIYMPIEIGDETKSYTFKFNVNDVTPVTEISR
jgi:hypothetical protein